MILQELQGFCLPLLIGTMLASVRLYPWSLAEERWSGHTYNWEANTTLDQGEMQSTCESKQQWHRKQWSLQLAVSKLAPQVLSEQGLLPSTKMVTLLSSNTLCLWKDFYLKQEDKMFRPSFLVGRLNQEQLCTPMETCSPILGLSMTEDKLGHILPPPGLDEHCTPCTDLSDRGKHLPRSPGLGNLQESLYVEYCGWLYGLPENSLPKLKRQRQNKRSFDLR